MTAAKRQGHGRRAFLGPLLLALAVGGTAAVAAVVLFVDGPDVPPDLRLPIAGEEEGALVSAGTETLGVVVVAALALVAIVALIVLALALCCCKRGAAVPPIPVPPLPGLRDLVVVLRGIEGGLRAAAGTAKTIATAIRSANSAIDTAIELLKDVSVSKPELEQRRIGNDVVGYQTVDAWTGGFEDVKPFESASADFATPKQQLTDQALALDTLAGDLEAVADEVGAATSALGG